VADFKETNVERAGSAPELWGGVECSLWRIDNRYHDQLEMTGHYRWAMEDFERFAELGIKMLRYPVLLEFHERDKNYKKYFDDTEVRLNKIRSLGIIPIVEFMHHGCGPSHATFLDKNFVPLMRNFAKEVAARFQWLEYYCPVNEPLTTARFSGLYGIWYPHAFNDKIFARIFVAQIMATIVAIQEIRKVNPAAKFIQTEDLCKVYSTSTLSYQAEFENARRWLTFDALTGRIVPGHPLWDYLLWIGISKNDLQFISANATPPDILGLDHYLTSERYLDENIENYPNVPTGGNGRHEYVDIEAIRVKLSEPSGLPVLVRECWQRYQLPMALSEIHIGCSTANQIRWFNEAWNVASFWNAVGVPIKGVCAWALLGAYGWSDLLRKIPGTYEPGVFDVEFGRFKDNDYAQFLKSIGHQEKYQHDTLNEAGWWRRDDRFIYPKQVLSKAV
jgi:dTDP-4-dehydrorhamnose reductase